MNIMYVRVSTEHQHEIRQVVMANNLDIAPENIFIDKATGKDTKREKLNEMLLFVRRGDVLYTESISRFARNTVDLLKLVEQLNNKGVEFVSLKEKIDTRTPQGKFMLTVFGAMATLEREQLLERQAEGIAEAKKRNVYKGRKPKEINEKKFIAMCKEWRNGEITAVSIQREFNITATTFYRWVKEKEL